MKGGRKGREAWDPADSIDVGGAFEGSSDGGVGGAKEER